MNNYPPGTWEGDPFAPWNEADPWEGHECRECVYCVHVPGAHKEACVARAVLDSECGLDFVNEDDAACEVFELKA